jgi:hypothetical protein
LPVLVLKPNHDFGWCLPHRHREVFQMTKIRCEPERQSDCDPSTYLSADTIIADALKIVEQGSHDDSHERNNKWSYAAVFE